MSVMRKIIFILIFLTMIPCFCVAQNLNDNEGTKDSLLIHNDAFSLDLYKYADSNITISRKELKEILKSDSRSAVFYNNYEKYRCIALVSLCLLSGCIVADVCGEYNNQINTGIRAGIIISSGLLLFSNRKGQNNLDKSVDYYNYYLCK